MRFSRDITDLVNDLAATEGVSRVLIRRESPEGSKIERVFPSRFKADEQIFLEDGCTLRIEAMWQIDGPSKNDEIDFVNRLRAEYDLGPIRCMVIPASVQFRPNPGIWEGEWKIEPVD